MEPNVYLTRKQKLLIIRLAETSQRSLKQTLDSMINHECSVEEYEVLERHFQQEFQALNELCRAVYKK